MNNYFIGGVATVACFQNNEHIFTAKTLTDSSINISVSSEEIRGGMGAQLLGKFFHTTVFNLTMTDALFNLKYFIGQTGATQDDSGEAVIWETPKLVTVTGNTVTITLKDGDSMGEIDFDTHTSNGKHYVWCEQLDITREATGSGSTWSFQPGAEYVNGFETGKYCVTYPTTRNGKQLIVNTDYAPGIYSLIMRAKLFAGDSCQISNGKPVGEIVIEIPRFQLDGTIDLAMAMTSPATYTLNGSALANGCSCGESAWYAKITQVLVDDDPYFGYTGIVVDDDTIEDGATLGVYAFATGKLPKSIPFTMLAVDNSTGANVSKINDDGTVVLDANAASSTLTVSDPNTAISGQKIVVSLPNNA